MKLFTAAGILYRGADGEKPDEVWHYGAKRWVPYRQDALDPSELREINAEQADRLKTNNPDAEHYLYYDTAPWAQGSKASLEMPDHLLERAAAYAAELAARSSKPR